MTWVVVALTLAVVLGLWWWLTGPTPVTLESPSSVPTMLRTLLANGVDGGELCLQVRGAPSRQLMFLKYIVAHNDVGFRGFFYETQDTGGYFDSLRDELLRRNIEHQVAEERDRSRHLILDFSRDVGLAHMVVRLVFEHIFAVRIEKDCIAFFRRVLVDADPALTGVDLPER